MALCWPNCARWPARAEACRSTAPLPPQVLKRTTIACSPVSSHGADQHVTSTQRGAYAPLKRHLRARAVGAVNREHFDLITGIPVTQ